METGVKAGPPPPQIPDHELLRRIGQGSYGEVWLARNVIGTLRAVKVVHRSTFDRERPYEREYEGIQKFEPVSRSHEGLVDILQVGRNDTEGYFYYVMELADSSESVISNQCSVISNRSATPDAAPGHAGSLNTDLLITDYSPKTLRAEQQLRARLPVSDCVNIGITLASALHALHERGLVHRDIKPSNIIFVGGVPKLADIGLVTDAGEARSYVGTEGFILPEGPGTPAADLFSLGKVLYEASTGKDRQDFPEPLTNLGDQPDKDRLLELNAVIHRACQSDPRARYRSAAEMLAELELLQCGESVKRKRALAQRVTFAKRFSVVAILVTLLLASVVFLSHRQSEQKRIRRQEAHQLLLEGRKHADRLTKDEFSKAVELYHQAIALEPDYAPPYVGLAEAYVTVSGWHLRPKEAMSQARWAITKALKLDDKSGAAHVWLGMIKKVYDWDWTGAEREFMRAIKLAPDDEIGYDSLAMLHAGMGRFDEAEMELAHAQRLAKGPSHRDGYDVGLLLFLRRRYEEAIDQARKTLALDTNSMLNHSLLMDCYVKTERYPEAIAEGQILRRLDDAPYVVAELGYTYAVMRHTDEARRFLAKLDEYSGQRHVSPYFKGFIHLGLGETEPALDCLEAAYEERFGWLGGLKVDPFWDDLRAEPRFIALLRKINLDK